MQRLKTESLPLPWQLLHWIPRALWLHQQLASDCSPASGLALRHSQLFKHPSVMMTKILSGVGSRALYFGLEMLTKRFDTSKTRLVGLMARQIRECSLLGNMNHCLDLDFLIDSVSKAKLIVRASFSDIWDLKRNEALAQTPLLTWKIKLNVEFGIILLPFRYSLMAKCIPGS